MKLYSSPFCIISQWNRRKLQWERWWVHTPHQLWNGIRVVQSKDLCIVFCRPIVCLFVILFWSLHSLSSPTDCFWLPLGIQTFGHGIVCPSPIYEFWLLLGFQTFGHGIVCPSPIYEFWLPLGIQTFGHGIICPSLIYEFWLPLLVSLTLSYEG